MAATAKQLANLKKARAARKRNLAATKRAGTSKKKPAKRKSVGRVQVKAKSVKKATKRKAPAKRKKNPAPKKRKGTTRNYLVYLKYRDTLAYYKNNIMLTTIKAHALRFTKAGAEKTAREIFDKYGDSPHFEWVKVVKK